MNPLELSRRDVVAASGIAMTAFASGCTITSDSTVDLDFSPEAPPAGTWPLPRYDAQRSNSNPNASPPRDPVRISESFETDVGLVSDLLVGEECLVVYGGNGAEMRGLSDGDVLWETDSAIQTAGFGPSEDDGRTLYLVAGGPTRSTVAVSALRVDGNSVERRYRRTLDSHSTFGQAVLPTSERLYLGGNALDVAVLDAGDGDHVLDLQGNDIALADGTLVATTGATVRAYEATTASDDSTDDIEPDWERTVSRGRLLGPAVAGDRVVCGGRGFGSDTGRLHARSLRDGSRSWEPRSFGYWTNTPAVRETTGYVTGSGGRLAAVSLDSGTVAWDVEFGTGVDEAVLAGDSTLLVRRNPDDESGSRTGTANGYVDAFDVGTSDELWSFEPNADGAIRALCAVDDRLYVCVGNSVSVLRAR